VHRVRGVLDEVVELLLAPRQHPLDVLASLDLALEDAHTPLERARLGQQAGRGARHARVLGADLEQHLRRRLRAGPEPMPHKSSNVWREARSFHSASSSTAAPCRPSSQSSATISRRPRRDRTAREIRDHRLHDLGEAAFRPGRPSTSRSASVSAGVITAHVLAAPPRGRDLDALRREQPLRARQRWSLGRD
jgi:hypothetical protein